MPLAQRDQALYEALLCASDGILEAIESPEIFKELSQGARGRDIATKFIDLASKDNEGASTLNDERRSEYAAAAMWFVTPELSGERDIESEAIDKTRELGGIDGVKDDPSRPGIAAHFREWRGRKANKPPRAAKPKASAAQSAPADQPTKPEIIAPKPSGADQVRVKVQEIKARLDAKKPAEAVDPVRIQLPVVEPSGSFRAATMAEHSVLASILDRLVYAGTPEGELKELADAFRTKSGNPIPTQIYNFNVERKPNFGTPEYAEWREEREKAQDAKFEEHMRNATAAIFEAVNNNIKTMTPEQLAEIQEILDALANTDLPEAAD